MSDPTPPEKEEEENFSEFLETLSVDPVSPELDDEESDDPFDTPPAVAPGTHVRKDKHKNWLEHGLTETVSMEKKKRGRPVGSKGSVHKRNNAVKEAIQVMTAAGVKKSIMARLLRISLPTLIRNFADEMELGKEMLDTRITNVFIKKALDGNMPALLHYLKSKTGMREIEKDENPNENARLSDVERNQRLMSLFMARPDLLEKVRQRQLDAAPINLDKVESEVKKDVFDI